MRLHLTTRRTRSDKLWRSRAVRAIRRLGAQGALALLILGLDDACTSGAGSPDPEPDLVRQPLAPEAASEVAVSPREARALVGSEVEFEVRFPDGVPRPLVLPNWVRWSTPDVALREAELGRGLVRATLVVGRFRSREAYSRSQVPLPEVTVEPEEGLAPIELQELRTPAPYAPGLTLQRKGDRCRVVYSMGTIRGKDCGERVESAAGWTLARRDGALTLVGFASSKKPDDCRVVVGAPEPELNPRLEGSFDLRPEDSVHVELFHRHDCFLGCDSGYERLTSLLPASPP